LQGFGLGGLRKRAGLLIMIIILMSGFTHTLTDNENHSQVVEN